MRPFANFTLHAILAAALASLAATSAAAADAFLKIEGHKGEGSAAEGPGKGEWIEIHSWSWGESNATVRGLKLQPGGGGSGAAGGVQVAAGDLDGDGRADRVATSEVVSPRDAGSGLPTGKRQHKPITITKEWDARTVATPHVLEKGSMTLRGRVTACAAGTTYPAATLVTRTYKYEFQDVIIGSCSTSGGGGGGAMPMEEVSFSYAKLVYKPASSSDFPKWDVKNEKKP